MPRDLCQQPSLARSFGIPSAGGASLTIRKSRHRADPPVPPWCKLTPAILRQGRGSVQYEHCIDRYAIEELEVTDHQRRVIGSPDDDPIISTELAPLNCSTTTPLP